MAFGSLGTLGGTGGPKVSGGTCIITTTAAAQVGNIILVGSAWDNEATSDGDTTQLSCADSAGNTYTRVRERTNTEAGLADDGVCVTLFRSVVTVELALGGTITVTSASNRTAKGANAWEFSKAAGTTLAVEATDFANGEAVDPAVITLSGLPSREYLFVGVIGQEQSTAVSTVSEASGNYTEFGQQGTSGGGGVSNMLVEAAFRILTGTGDSIDFVTSSDTNTHCQIYAAIFEEVGGVVPAPSDDPPIGILGRGAGW